MKLTALQIDHLFTFTRQHYVEWYDLQSELVDHLANAIESQWEKNPKVTFDEALTIEFKKFGVFGFMDVVEKRQAVLRKKYNGVVWEHIKGFFGIPKIVLTIAMTLVLFSILKLENYREWIFIGFFITLFGFLVYEMIKNNRIRKKKNQIGGKRWLFEEIINQYGGFTGIIALPFNMFIQFFNHNENFSNNFWTLGLSFFLVLFSLVFFVVFKIIPSKATEYLAATYPEYKLENL